MRTLKSGKDEIRIRASNVALFYFNQAFNDEAMASLMVTAVKVISTQNILNGKPAIDNLASLDIASYDFSTIRWDVITAPATDIFRLCWAMAKAQAKAENKSLENFEDWLIQMEGVKVRDIQVGVFEEAVDGFFREKAVLEKQS